MVIRCIVSTSGFCYIHMNKRQKQIIGIELVVVTLLLWRYYSDQLTFINTFVYALIYIFCMAGWYYFKD